MYMCMCVLYIILIIKMTRRKERALYTVQFTSDVYSRCYPSE